MHGDDVASAGVSVSTQIVSKATEILLDMLKVAIEKEREAARLKQSEKKQVLSGGEVTYQKLKEGGEVAMLPSFDKDDYGEFLKRAKEMDIPVAAIQEHGKENTLSLFFNVKDKEAVNAIVQDIVREKLKQPEQTERMITIEKEQVEGFQMYCSDHDIPVNFMETQNGVKSIRQHLKVEDTETVKAIMTKAERLGFVDEPKQVQFKEYLIERETQSAFTVRGGSTVVRLDLSDRETAKKQLMDSFGMTAAKAERIIDKARKQTVVNNLLKKAKAKAALTADAIKHKKLDRGSRK